MRFSTDRDAEADTVTLRIEDTRYVLSRADAAALCERLDEELAALRDDRGLPREWHDDCMI